MGGTSCCSGLPAPCFSCLESSTTDVAVAANVMPATRVSGDLFPSSSGVPNGPVHARGQIECLYRPDRRGRGGLADLVGARPRRLVLWVGEPNFWRRWPTIHLDGPCVGDDATHEGQPRNLQCPPVPTPAPACIPGRPTSAPPPAPKPATTSGRTRGAVRGCVSHLPPA